MFPSAISRYLVSNHDAVQRGMSPRRFHPLYRGTWFPTSFENASGKIAYQFPSAISRYLVSNPGLWKFCSPDTDRFPSAISRYLVSNIVHLPTLTSWTHSFPSAISRYLVSNVRFVFNSVDVIVKFPSAISRYLVSNSYHADETKELIKFPSAISRYLVSNPSNYTVWRIIAGLVSIRYIAVLGFQHLTRTLKNVLSVCFHPLYRGTWFPTLPEKHPL